MMQAMEKEHLQAEMAASEERRKNKEAQHERMKEAAAIKSEVMNSMTEASRSGRLGTPI